MSTMYLLLFDVGNTNTKIGLSQDGRLLGSYSFPSSTADTADTWGFRVLEICRYWELAPEKLTAWIISSVVPPLNDALKVAGDRFCACPVHFVPKDIGVPLENHYARPQEVGADRLVTALAARRRFATPAIIVVDFGTATTFDCIQDKAYLGGLICPGVLSSAKGLALQTAKLPQISLELDSDEVQIGMSTSTSLNHGFLFGFASMIEGLCARIQKHLFGEVTVVATGGFGRRLQPVCPCLEHVEPDLLLQGLQYAADQLSCDILGGQPSSSQRRS
ncbi:type III pantothenate kinase [Desulfohalobium retbaense]|uniref:Type III pantothenate kinase n=1 Tax=Desulfohalobium retbaense (strain ATCC 49708 / DSM 5692 / JCM 16813 / HR100) TaxID=485915 RepID=C8X0C4_DESRD|nr:type III pantothenate kinase [Desulfohalobium retbaense]ACV67749.1 putative transcriptional acitvator, Baf family [Desulfohalobium retbaense DSM 5692]